MSLLFFMMTLLTSQAKRIYSCDLPNTPSYILTKFYRPTCPYSIKIVPTMEEIESRLDKAGADIIIRYKNCNECECKKEDRIITVPTLTITKHGIEIDRHRGSADYKTYVEFILKSTRFKKDIFYNEIKSPTNNIVSLKDSDFEDGIVGPWIVYFYDHKDEAIYSSLKEIAKSYAGKLKIGKVNAVKDTAVIRRFNIQAYPLILAMHDNVYEPLHTAPTKTSITSLADLLIEPEFQSIRKEKFLEITQVSKLPVFVVLHSDFNLANQYFKNIAHSYKFRTKIWQSDDKELFELLGAHPKEQSENNIVKDRDRLILMVHKEGELHEYTGELNEDDISEWIFHSHFPHVTRIKNDNFFSVFHGFKPILLLVSGAEEFLLSLEVTATKHQSGKPFGKYVFAYLDTNTYPMFVETLIKGINIPFITIFDPIKQLFYYIPNTLNEKGFEKLIGNLISRYESGKIKPYKHKQKKWFIVGLLFILLSICGLLLARFRWKKYSE